MSSCLGRPAERCGPAPNEVWSFLDSCIQYRPCGGSHRHGAGCGLHGSNDGPTTIGGPNDPAMATHGFSGDDYRFGIWHYPAQPDGRGNRADLPVGLIDCGPCWKAFSLVNIIRRGSAFICNHFVLGISPRDAACD